jgi:structure-specific recognition protein 1
MSQAVLNFESIYVGGRNEAKEKGKFKISNVGMGFKSLESQEILTISQTDLSKLVFQKVARRYQLKIYKKNQSIVQFDGFEKTDFDQINTFTKQNFNKNLELKEISTRGYNWGSIEFDDASLLFDVHGKEAFEIPLIDVTNSATAGKRLYIWLTVLIQ